MKVIDDLKLVFSFFAAVGAVCFAFANRYTVFIDIVGGAGFDKKEYHKTH